LKTKQGSISYMKRLRIDRLLKKIQLNFLWMETFQSRSKDPFYKKTGQKKMAQIKRLLEIAWRLDHDYVSEKQPQIATFYYVNIKHYESLMIMGFNEKMREHPILRKRLSEKGIDPDELLQLFPVDTLNVKNPFMMIVPGVPTIYAPNSLKLCGEYILQQTKDLSVMKEMASFVGLMTN